jgi:hypothetical protein
VKVKSGRRTRLLAQVIGSWLEDAISSASERKNRAESEKVRIIWSRGVGGFAAVAAETRGIADAA